MITVIKKGGYTLIETKKHTKILILDNDCFAWINAAEIGEILVASHRRHLTDHILAKNIYRLYAVRNEPDLTDLLHLELYVGEGVWQGYLLPTGLPNDKKKRNRIIPTKELVTVTSR